MATSSGLLQTYINTIPDKRMVSDRILMIEPYNIATYLALGTDMGKFNMTNREGKVYEWIEDTYNAVTDTMASNTMVTNTTTAVTFTPTDTSLYQPGDILLIGSEQMWVSSVSSGTPTVTRGWGGTTHATHTSGDTVTIVGRARIDGDDADASPSTAVSSNYNYTQILQRTVNVARSKLKLAEYGISNWEDYLISKYVKELTMFLNKLPFYGKRASDVTDGGAGSATRARTAGGLRTFITDNLTYGTASAATGGTAIALTRHMIDDTLEGIWSDGGQPDLIVCGSWAQRKLNDFYEGFIMTSPEYNIGGNIINKLRHPIDGSILDILVDRACPTNEMWFLSRDKIAFYPFDPFFYEKLAKTGDANLGEVIGEYGFVCQNDKAHGAVLEFSTSV
jgi:hypothetical protein